MKIKPRLVGGVALVLMLASSCSAPKDITYMQGFEQGDTQKVTAMRRITLQPDDAIGITVTSKDPALAEVFNLMVPQRRIGAGSESTRGNSGVASYTVDPSGDINFPILGKIHVAGMTRPQLEAEIEKRLLTNKLLNDAVVTVDFLNANIAVLGDVKSPGEYPIDRDNMTVLQALSKAGDLNITGLRNNVLVVREENGKDVAYRLDLTNAEQLMQSPAYYLQQNDVVYVEPNDTKKRQATINGTTVLTPSFWLSVASFITTISVLIFK